MATWNSRGLRGSTLEEFINRTNEKYLENGLALIQKVPTPITPINIDKATRHITLAYFDQNSTVAQCRGFRLVLMQRNVTQTPSHFRISMSIRWSLWRTSKNRGGLPSF